MEILRSVGITNRKYVEFGVEDGKQCNSRILREILNFTGLMMDGGFEDLNINLRKEFITAANILELFSKYNITKSFDVLSIDTDMYDWWILLNILLEYKPRIVITEVNPTIGIGTKDLKYHLSNINKYAITVPHPSSTKQTLWDYSRYSGANPMAFKLLAAHTGYEMVYCDQCGVNCFLILKSALPKECGNISFTLPQISYPCYSTLDEFGSVIAGHRVDRSNRPVVLLTDEMVYKLVNNKISPQEVQNLHITNAYLSSLASPKDICDIYTDDSCPYNDCRLDVCVNVRSINHDQSAHTTCPSLHLPTVSSLFQSHFPHTFFDVFDAQKCVYVLQKVYSSNATSATQLELEYLHQESEVSYCEVLAKLLDRFSVHHFVKNELDQSKWFNILSIVLHSQDSVRTNFYNLITTSLLVNSMIDASIMSFQVFDDHRLWNIYANTLLERVADRDQSIQSILLGISVCDASISDVILSFMNKHGIPNDDVNTQYVYSKLHNAIQHQVFHDHPYDIYSFVHGHHVTSPLRVGNVQVNASLAYTPIPECFQNTVKAIADKILNFCSLHVASKSYVGRKRDLVVIGPPHSGVFDIYSYLFTSSTFFDSSGGAKDGAGDGAGDDAGDGAGRVLVKNTALRYDYVKRQQMTAEIYASILRALGCTTATTTPQKQSLGIGGVERVDVVDYGLECVKSLGKVSRENFSLDAVSEGYRGEILNILYRWLSNVQYHSAILADPVLCFLSPFLLAVLGQSPPPLVVFTIPSDAKHAIFCFSKELKVPLDISTEIWLMYFRAVMYAMSHQTSFVLYRHGLDDISSIIPVIPDVEYKYNTLYHDTMKDNDLFLLPYDTKVGRMCPKLVGEGNDKDMEIDIDALVSLPPHVERCLGIMFAVNDRDKWNEMCEF